MRTIWRAVRREPLQILAIIVSLSVGLGAGAAVFAFLDHIWLAPLPYAEPNRVLRIWETPPQSAGGSSARRGAGVSYSHYLTLLEHSRSLEGVALYGNYKEMEVSNRTVTLKTSLASVTSQFFPILGVAPLEGRWLATRLTETPEREAVVCEQLWQRLFPGQELSGQSLRILGDDYPIVGIMPNSFGYPGNPTQVWVPKPPPPPEEGAQRYSSCLARRRPDTSHNEVAAELGRFFDRSQVRVLSLPDDIYGDVRGPLQWLGGAIGMVLLTALLNAGTLQFARLNRRWKDFGIRAALGAGSRRLASGLLLESLLLTAAAAGLGFAVFSGLFVLVTKSWPGEIPGLHAFSLWAPRPLLLLGGEALLCAALLGCLSLWFVQRLRVLDRLALGQESAPFLAFRVRLNGAIVSAQLAAGVVLLISAGVMVRSFIAAVTRDLGYQPEGVLAAGFELPEELYPNREVQGRAVGQVIERLSQVEGVEAVGFSSTLPMRGYRGEMTIRFPSLDLMPKVAFGQVSPGFFKALGLRIIQGSPFPDLAAPEPGLVVTESLAKAYLGERPIGSVVLLSGRPYRVSGVAGEVVQDGFLGSSEPGLYFHYLQPPDDSFVFDSNRGYCIMRVRGRLSSYAGTVRGVIETVAAGALVEWIRPLGEILTERVAKPRFWTLLGSCLGLLALLFSTIALYAMMSYNVSQRIPELAVRMTLGATPAEIRRMVLRSAAAIIAKGLAVGLMASLLVAALFGDLLFGAARLQPLTWVLCLSILASTALLAAYIPARRGAETEPSLCLRST